MNIHTCSEVRCAEAALFESGAVSSDELMDAAIASAACTLAEDAVFGRADIIFDRVIVYAGKGKNAGDAVGLARTLGFSKIILRCAVPLHDMASETQRQIGMVDPGRLSIASAAPSHAEKALIIDGLLGSGAHGALRPDYAELAREMNTLRDLHPRSMILAVDIPSGLDAERGDADTDAVRADATLAIACVKPGMLADGAENYTGRLLCSPLPQVHLPPSRTQALDSSTLRWLPRRVPSCYKNKAGRVRIIAGSVGYAGAAEMCSAAALAAGAGLVELYCRHDIYPILAARLRPEIMVHPVCSYDEVTSAGADALLIGPGLGTPDTQNTQALHALLLQADCPIVLDADALNLAALHGWRIPHHAILTPHPGEMRRLFPAADKLSRAACAADFVRHTPCTLLYKGARSIITDGESFCYNTTGGPYMANGGQGDVLAGVVTALAAQGLPPLKAAALAAYLCGRAATAAWAAQGRPLSVNATDILPHLTVLD